MLLMRSGLAIDGLGMDSLIGGMRLWPQKIDGQGICFRIHPLPNRPFDVAMI
jgi:hypothetical protein